MHTRQPENTALSSAGQGSTSGQSLGLWAVANRWPAASMQALKAHMSWLPQDMRKL